jgi:uroporphyrinogen III methyltransferase/synthase
MQEAQMKPPAITVVGEVVRLRDQLGWFDARPLFGQRVLVTRSREQASALSARLRELGADPIEFPTIRTLPPDDSGPMDRAIAQLATYDWLILTSVNGVKYFMGRLLNQNLDARALAGIRLASIGPATAAELEKYTLRVDYVPDNYVAEAVAAGLDVSEGDRVLLPRADLARPTLVEELRARGCAVDEVVAYRTVPHEHSSEAIDALFQKRFDIVTFTSSSTVRNLVTMLQDRSGGNWRDLFDGTTVACIGPITAETAQQMGLEPDIVADEYTIQGLVQAVVDSLTR